MFGSVVVRGSMEHHVYQRNEELIEEPEFEVSFARHGRSTNADAETWIARP